MLKGDRGRLRRLIRYMARPAVSFERVTYDDRAGKVIVRSCKKMNGQRPVKGVYDALTFLALLTLQVPPPGAHMVRYFGHYSSRSRATRRKETETNEATSAPLTITEVPSPRAKERRPRWAELIHQVFEVDPLQCECGGRLRFISFTTRGQKDVLVKILDHIGEPSEPAARGPPKWYQLLLAQQHVEANRHVYGF